MIRRASPPAPLPKQAKAGPWGHGEGSHPARFRRGTPRGAGRGCGKWARARKAGAGGAGARGGWGPAPALPRVAAAAAPGPASPGQHRSLFTSPAAPPSLPPATRAAAAAASPSRLRAPPALLPPAPASAPPGGGSSGERARRGPSARRLPPALAGVGPHCPAPSRPEAHGGALLPAPLPRAPRGPGSPARGCGCGADSRAPWALGLSPDLGEKSRRDGEGGRGSWSLFTDIASSDFSSHLQPSFLARGKIQVAAAKAERTGTHPLGGSDAPGSPFVVRSALTPWTLNGTSAS